MLLFCPHCDEITEFRGLPRKPEPQCDCGGVLEPVANDNAGDEIGARDHRAAAQKLRVAFLSACSDELAAQGHPEVARRLTAEFAKRFPVAS